jgi:hypothetical protein
MERVSNILIKVWMYLNIGNIDFGNVSFQVKHIKNTKI